MAKRNYHVENHEIDNDFFAEAIDSQLTEGKAYLENPSMSDYVDFYGSTRAVAQVLVDEGEYSNIKSAQRQVQRMVANPDIRVTPRVKAKLGALDASDVTPTMISVVGKFTYDGYRWAYGSFDYTPSQEQLREIVYAARPSNFNRNQESLDTFMDAYDVGMHFMFAKGSTVEITPMDNWGRGY